DRGPQLSQRLRRTSLARRPRRLLDAISDSGRLHRRAADRDSSRADLVDVDAHVLASLGTVSSLLLRLLVARVALGDLPLQRSEELSGAPRTTEPLARGVQSLGHRRVQVVAEESVGDRGGVVVIQPSALP